MVSETIEVSLRVDERSRLEHYARYHGMSVSAVMRQALRVYDVMAQTVGAYEVLNTLTRAKLGPILHADDVASSQDTLAAYDPHGHKPAHALTLDDQACKAPAIERPTRSDSSGEQSPKKAARVRYTWIEQSSSHPEDYTVEYNTAMASLAL